MRDAVCLRMEVGRGIPLEQEGAGRPGVDRVLMRVDEIDRLLCCVHRLAREPEEEESVIPDPGPGAVPQDPAHRRQLGALVHALDRRLRCGLQSEEQHATPTLRHGLQQRPVQAGVEARATAPMDIVAAVDELRRHDPEYARGQGLVGEEDMARAVPLLERAHLRHY